MKRLTLTASNTKLTVQFGAPRKPRRILTAQARRMIIQHMQQAEKPKPSLCLAVSAP